MLMAFGETNVNVQAIATKSFFLDVADILDLLPTAVLSKT